MSQNTAQGRQHPKLLTVQTPARVTFLDAWCLTVHKLWRSRCLSLQSLNHHARRGKVIAKRWISNIQNTCGATTARKGMRCWALAYASSCSTDQLPSSCLNQSCHECQLCFALYTVRKLGNAMQHKAKMRLQSEHEHVASALFSSRQFKPSFDL